MQGGGFQIYHKPTRSGIHRRADHRPGGGGRGLLPGARGGQPQERVACPRSPCSCRARASGTSPTPSSPRGETSSSELEGALHALLNLHYSVDILAEHQLQPRLEEFPLVVVPDSHKLTAEFRKALTDYVEQGGSLLLLGEKCARLFEPILGVAFEGEPPADGEDRAN